SNLGVGRSCARTRVDSRPQERGCGSCQCPPERTPMKIPFMLIGCAIALGAGLWLGADQAPNQSSPTRTNASHISVWHDSASREPRAVCSRPASELRFGRLVTALKEQTLLKQRHELYEQL